MQPEGSFPKPAVKHERAVCCHGDSVCTPVTGKVKTRRLIMCGHSEAILEEPLECHLTFQRVLCLRHDVVICRVRGTCRVIDPAFKSARKSCSVAAGHAVL